MRNGRRLRDPPGRAGRPHHTSPRSTARSSTPGRSWGPLKGLCGDQLAVLLRMAGRAVARHRLRDVILLDALELLLDGLAHELGERAIVTSLDESLHPVELRL